MPTELTLNEEQARAFADVYRSMLAHLAGEAYWVCSDLTQAHVTRMLSVFADVTLGARISEGQGRGLTEDEARAELEADLRHDLDEIEMRMLQNGWPLSLPPATTTEPTPDNPDGTAAP